MPQAQSNSPTDTPACLSASWQYICKESAIFLHKEQQVGSLIHIFQYSYSTQAHLNIYQKVLFNIDLNPNFPQKAPDKSLCTVTIPTSQPQHPVLNNILNILLPLGSDVYISVG